MPILADEPMSEVVNGRQEEDSDESNVEEREDTEEVVEDSTDSEEEERSICRSPSKSPRKICSILKRKREVPDEQEDFEENSVDSEEESAAESLPTAANSEPTDQDFQFKEPKFRKKKFIFHPFEKNPDGKFSPDPHSSAVEV